MYQAQNQVQSRAQYLAFALGDQHFGLPLAAVKEVFALPRLDLPPGLPAMLAGFVRLGSETLPVLDLFALLGLPLSRHIDQHLILLRDRPLLCLVDRVLGLRSGELVPIASEQSFNDQLLGALDDLYVFAPERLLLAEEFARVEALRQLAAARLQSLSAADELAPEAGS